MTEKKTILYKTNGNLDEKKFNAKSFISFLRRTGLIKNYGQCKKPRVI